MVEFSVADDNRALRRVPRAQPTRATRMARAVVVSGAALLLLCASVTNATADEDGPATPDATDVSAPAVTDGDSGPPVESTPESTVLPRPVERVIQQVADQLGIATTDIQVTAMDPVIWPDSCLGLPASE